MPVSPTAAAVVIAPAEQPTQEPTLLRVLLGRNVLLLRRYVLLSRRGRRLGGGVELRFGLGQHFELSPVKEDPAAAGALVNLHPEPGHRQHLLATLRAEHDRSPRRRS